MAAPMITLTEAAAERVKRLMAKADKPAKGLRIGVKTRGCSGHSDSSNTRTRPRSSRT